MIDQDANPRDVVVPAGDAIVPDEADDLSLTASNVVTRVMAFGVLLVVLGLCAAGVLAWMHHGHQEEAKAARRAEQVAATSLEQLLSFTPTDVLAKASSESKLMTGKLRTTYTDQLEKDWGPAAEKGGISSKAEVLRVARVSARGDSVKLVVYANITRTVASSGQNDVIASTMLITMQKVDGTWRISEYKGV